ncbi:FlaA1/EpsC-like NDP-sugar epimerase [Alkalibacillus salilacus]|uniref:FlaA1/EpsC-like NDP-sugar epimerase n=1 Tax=Alkalibacillus salilacus TaxID=284582 RepID=A0ABT9VJ94_9BACI|nr:FlaA1/EpsC-like NDP-sugar epimerase [Alkalibacillus salilacus]
MKKFPYTVLVSIICLILIALILPEYKENLNYYDVEWIWIYSVILSILFFLFGILIEGQRLVQVFTEKTEINWIRLCLVSILIILVFIPTPYWTMFLPNNIFLLNFMFQNEILAILNVLAGILFVRSFNIKN